MNIDVIVEKIRKLLPRVNVSAYEVYSGCSYFYYRVGPFNNGAKGHKDRVYSLSRSASQKFKDFKREMWENRETYGSSILGGLLFLMVADGKNRFGDPKIKDLQPKQHPKLTERIYALPEFKEAFVRTKAQVKQITEQINLKDQQYTILKQEARQSIKANAKSFSDKIPLTEICELMDEVVRELTVEGVMKE